MPINFIGFVFVLLGFSATILCFFTSLLMTRRIPFTPHRFFTIAVALMSLSIVRHIPAILFLDLAYRDLIQIVEIIGFLSMATFGLFFALAMAIALPKGRVKQPLITTVIFAAGAMSFASLVPGAWEIVLTPFRWEASWQIHLVLASGFALTSWAVLFILYSLQVSRAINRSQSRLYKTSASILLGSIVILVFAGVLFLIGKIVPIFPWYLYFIPLSISAWGITIANWLNPTVLIVAAPAVHYFFVVDLRNGLPLFVFNFDDQAVEHEGHDLEMLSLILGAVKSVLGEITSSMRRISCISTPFGEVLIEELGPVGSFLLTDGEVSASRSSLRHCTRDFLNRYSSNLAEDSCETSQFHDFADTVLKYFSFAF